MIARLAFIALIAGAGPALAGQPVTLKAETLDADGQVTLGDLFDGAGSAAKTPVATRTGLTVVLDAGAVQAVARRAGLDWPNAEGYRRIVVRSPSTAVYAPSPSSTSRNADCACRCAGATSPGRISCSPA